MWLGFGAAVVVLSLAGLAAVYFFSSSSEAALIPAEEESQAPQIPGWKPPEIDVAYMYADDMCEQLDYEPLSNFYDLDVAGIEVDDSVDFGYARGECKHRDDEGYGGFSITVYFFDTVEEAVDSYENHRDDYAGYDDSDPVELDAEVLEGGWYTIGDESDGSHMWLRYQDENIHVWSAVSIPDVDPDDLDLDEEVIPELITMKEHVMETVAM